MTRTMHAATYSTFGGPGVLSLTEQPLPKVAPGEVLVRVRSAAVNPVDWKIMAGGLDGMLESTFPIIPGWDMAGVVEAVGIDVPEYAPGDEVIGYVRKDFVHGGTYAEFVSAPVRTLARKPSGMDWDAAAGLPLAGLTAYQVLNRLGTGPGMTVLVHGGAGGVGQAGIQLARHAGARVIATASEHNHDLLRSLGAEPVSYGDGLADRVRALAPAGVDVVADFVGGVLDVTTAVLAEDGRHASVADRNVVQAGGQWMWVRPDADDLDHLAELVDAGDLVVNVARTFDLADAAAAVAASIEGHTAGKITIEVSS
ncbi:NADPH:quinone reductase [Raineyella antarctica]|uniref:NADPH:quinone reductase n=1 Tax=Raineyella antarctica TaxID=1577474 RepID=A0A1G6HRE2_9ACTN|nr:NADP-dependent oxidoreductase [Raineyella antarctica]SDB96771.1 NADPH:quinone reductase [Raineyella antarctica]